MNKSKEKIKFIIHFIILIGAFVLGIFVVSKGVKFNFKKKEPPKKEIVMTEVSNEYLDNQLLQDWKDEVLNADSYFKNLLFAEYDKEYLSNRYYQLKRYETPLETDFIASTYGSKISDTVMKYYLNRVLLTGVTFDINSENEEKKDGEIVAFVDTVHASDASKKVNLNRAVLSGNGNFVVWYTTTGSSAITENQAKEIAYNLESSRYTYDSLYSKNMRYERDFYNTGSIEAQQIRVLTKENINSSYLKTAMQVYVVNYTETAAAKYVVTGKKLTEIYDKYQYGSSEGSIPGPYLLIKADSYNESKERTMQIVNRELFRHYQYNVFCPEDTCIINDDPYYFDATANFGSALATNKLTYKGFLNDWAAFARNHTGDLLSEDLIKEYGSKNIANALYLYLFYYSKIVPEGNKKIVDAIYEKKPFELLEQRAGDNYLTEIAQTMAIEHIKQSAGNANILASPEVESKLRAKDSVTQTTNVSNAEIEKLGIDYYILSKENNNGYKIEFGRSNAQMTCVLVGVNGNNYQVLAKSPVSNVNVQFNTDNYPSYSNFYIIIANTTISARNMYSLDIVAK